MKKIFNPFEQIAGYKALFYGLLVLFLTGLIGYFSQTHFPDIISVKMSEGYPLSYYFLQMLSNWLVLSVVLYLIAIIASSSSIRAVDIFGTQALARFPYLFAAFLGFSGSVERFSEYILSMAMKEVGEVSISTFDIVIAVLILILSILMMIWMVVLMYNAFRVSANLKGGKAAGLFILGFIIAMVVTFILGMQIKGLYR